MFGAFWLYPDAHEGWMLHAKKWTIVQNVEGDLTKMIKIENVEVYGWETAIRGMRNPLNSWDRIDSKFGEEFELGENDLNLMQRLIKAGSDHSKFMRMIIVSMDITAPLYWWKEYDTYKVGTVANSCSTMHKIHSRDLTFEDFSCEHLNGSSRVLLNMIINEINTNRRKYLREKNDKKQWWWQLIQLLPTSYNQKRTVLLNYEVVQRMYKARKNHKLDEWQEFCKTMELLLYANELIIGKEPDTDA